MNQYIGLLMVAEENDILERTLDHNSQYLDAFYVLDGTPDNTESERICKAHPKCWGYSTDAQLPRPPYTSETLCGYRQFIYEQAVADNGSDNWFLILHGDEVWTQDPRIITTNTRYDGFIYRLPFFFPREGEPWDDSLHPVDQLSWGLGPGWPEFRLFRGNPTVQYDPLQQFNTRPFGINLVAATPALILHYPYRSPEVQRIRADLHQQSKFDPDNFAHIVSDDAVYWTDEMIAGYMKVAWFSELREVKPSGTLAGCV
jgi:hypothetical protein